MDYYYDKMSFGQAFKQAREEGAKEFTWKGKRYNTKLATDKAPSKAPVRGLSINPEYEKNIAANKAANEKNNVVRVTPADQAQVKANKAAEFNKTYGGKTLKRTRLGNKIASKVISRIDPEYAGKRMAGMTIKDIRNSKKAFQMKVKQGGYDKPVTGELIAPVEYGRSKEKDVSPDFTKWYGTMDKDQQRFVKQFMKDNKREKHMAAIKGRK